MEKRRDDNGLVTKGYLRGEFKREFSEFRREMDLKIDQKFDEKFELFRADLVIWKDEILTSNERIAKKLDTWLTERAMIHVNIRD